MFLALFLIFLVLITIMMFIPNRCRSECYTNKKLKDNMILDKIV